MPTPAAVKPPTPENVRLYRAAALAWREELRRNDGNHKLTKSARSLGCRCSRGAEAGARDDARSGAGLRTENRRLDGAQAHHAWFWRGTHSE
jgi:hypothetical protein